MFSVLQNVPRYCYLYRYLGHLEGVARQSGPNHFISPTWMLLLKQHVSYKHVTTKQRPDQVKTIIHLYVAQIQGGCDAFIDLTMLSHMIHWTRFRNDSKSEPISKPFYSRFQVTKNRHTF